MKFYPPSTMQPTEWVALEAIDQLANSEFLTDVVRGAVQRGSEGMVIWRGLWTWGLSYSTGDIVAYNHGVYQAVTGVGVPGASQFAWVLLELVTHNQGMAEPEGEVVTYLGEDVTHDGVLVRYTSTI